MPDNDSESLESKVLDWLKKQGYSLEMRVAQTFKQVGFEVSHFENYLDPESNDLREIDVVASIKHQVGEIDISARLFVECKYLRKPWVIFISPRRFNPFSYFSRIPSANYNVHEWKTQDSVQGRLLARILLSLGRENTQVRILCHAANYWLWRNRNTWKRTKGYRQRIYSYNAGEQVY